MRFFPLFALLLLSLAPAQAALDCTKAVQDNRFVQIRDLRNQKKALEERIDDAPDHEVAAPLVSELNILERNISTLKGDIDWCEFRH